MLERRLPSSPSAATAERPGAGSPGIQSTCHTGPSPHTFAYQQPSSPSPVNIIFHRKDLRAFPSESFQTDREHRSCYYRYFMFPLAAESREFLDSPPILQCWLFHFHKQSEGTGDGGAVQLPLLWAGSRERWHSLGFGLLQICFLWFVIKTSHIFHFSTFCGCGSRKGRAEYIQIQNIQIRPVFRKQDQKNTL